MLNKATTPGGGAGLSIVNIDTKSGSTALVHALTGVPAGALIVITTANQQSQTNAAISSSPVLTWTKAADATSPLSPNAEIYTAVFTAGGSINITVNWGANVQTSVAYVITGQETILGGGAATAVNQGSASVGITTTKTNSIVFAVSSNWNAPTIPLTYIGSPVEAFIFRDPANGTWPHYYYNFATTGLKTVGYSAPNDVDNGTSTAVLEIRSGSGVAGNNAPIANAGANQTIVSPASSVNLSGSLSSDDVSIASYLWTRISGPNTPTITSPNTVNTSVTGLIVGVYIFRLLVTDGPGLNNFDEVQITVNAVGNTAPIANAGVNQTVTAPTSSVILDSSGSTDDVAIVSRTWSRISGPNTPTIVSPNGTTTSVTGLIPGVYVFRITVVDGGSLQSTDDVQITVNNAGNSAPSAPLLSSPSHAQTTVDLAWSAATDDVAVANYRVYRNNVLINTVSVATLTYQDTGLTNATTYTYRIEAVDTPGLFTPSNNISVTTGIVTPPTSFTFTALTGDYRAYWHGPDAWGGRDGALILRDQDNGIFNEAHRYRRFVWNDLETNTAGVYRLNATDTNNRLKVFLDACIAAKQLAGFGIMTCYPGQTSDNSFHTYNSAGGAAMAYPIPYHNMMQAEGTKDWIGADNAWTPNFNSMNGYITPFTNLIIAINAFLNTTHSSGIKYGDCIGYIDIRGMGAYGEWHSNGIVNGNVNQYPGFINPTANPGNAGTFPSQARLIQIIDAQRNNLPSWPLCTILNSFDGNFPNGGNYNGTGFDNTVIPAAVGQYIINNGNAWGDIGWRRDQWGDINDYYRKVPQQTNAITGIPTRWMTAPVIGEPPGYANSGTFVNGIHMRGLNQPAISGDDGGDNGRQVILEHPAMIGNSNYGYLNGNPIDINTYQGGDPAIEMKSAFAKMGCILRLQTGGGLDLSNPNTIGIQLRWRNFGVAPQYKKDWQVTYEIRTLVGALVWSAVSTLNLFSNAGLKYNTGSDTIISDNYPRPALTGNFQLSVRILDPKNYLEPLQLGIQGRQTAGGYILTNLSL